MQPPTPPPSTPEELRRLAAELERCAAHLRAAADAGPQAAQRATGRALATACRVLQWGQREKAA